MTAVHMPTGRSCEVVAIGVTGPTVAGTVKVRFLDDGERATVNGSTVHVLPHACP